MAEKNYYVILGIPPGESQAGVKHAFRDLAMRYHPDRAGPGGTRRFQEISEAYKTLGDRDRRAVYDEGLREKESIEVQASPGPDSFPPAEPFDAQRAETMERRDARPSRERISILRDFAAPYGAAHAILDRIWREFDDAWAPKSGHQDALHLGIHMSYEEALRGADVRIAVPVFYPCPGCHGSGHTGLYPCSRCQSTGTLLGEEHVPLRIPPMVEDGTVFRIPLDGLGIRNLYLTVLVRIEDVEEGV